MASLNNIPPTWGTDVTGWTGVNFIVTEGDWSEYTWIVVVGALAAFWMAWSIGANDVANSFGTTVGARTITLGQACCIAAVFEFVGAIALGGEVAKTIAGSITSPTYFQSAPEIFMYGMMCAIIAAAAWVTVATYWELAVSTTHASIGAVMGFGLVYGGSSAIIWNDRKDEFPYVSGFVPVVLAWFVSPIMSAILAAILFILNRTFILRAANCVTRAFWALPVLVTITVFINVFFVLYKGAKNTLKWSDSQAAWVAGATSAGCLVVMFPVTMWLMRRHANKQAALEQVATDAEANKGAADKDVKGAEELSDSMVDIEVEKVPASFMAKSALFVSKSMSKSKSALIAHFNMDIHDEVAKEGNVGIATMHANAEVFNPEAEEVYKYLQVFSACCVSFAHGANDVANAVGPFAGIFYVYQNRNVSSSANTPTWILVLGAAGIVIGLATYGYNIMKVLGVKMATMTPSRGFCAELATALTVSLASVYGLPVSTTQVIVGAEVGVGLCESLTHGTNWKLFGITFAGWVVTILIAGLLSAAIFAYGVYAPSTINLNNIRSYENALSNVIAMQLNTLNATNYANNVTYPGLFNRALNTNISGLATNLTSLGNYKKYGAPMTSNYLAVYKNATWLSFNYTIPTVGYNTTGTFNTTTAITVPR